MNDEAKCNPVVCPWKGNCKRYTMPSGDYQWYVEAPGHYIFPENGQTRWVCKLYWPNGEKERMRLAIVGSREFTDFDYMEKWVIHTITNDIGITVEQIVSGGARGADRLAENFAWKHHIPLQIFPANWNKYGKKAGYLRNIEIVDNSDFVIAFWNGESKGTKMTIDLAKKKLGEENVVIIQVPS